MIQYIKERELTVEWILDTHIHADHITGSHYLQQALGAGKIGIGAKIKGVLQLWVPIFNSKNDTNGKECDWTLSLVVKNLDWVPKMYNIQNHEFEFDISHSKGTSDKGTSDQDWSFNVVMKSRLVKAINGTAISRQLFLHTKEIEIINELVCNSLTPLECRILNTDQNDLKKVLLVKKKQGEKMTSSK